MKKGQGGGLPQGDAGAAPVRLQQRCGADPAAARRPRLRGLQCAWDDPQLRQGIKDYSNWPTIPQVYLNEFVGGCDILLQMHQNGDTVEELKKLGIRSALLDEAKGQDRSEGRKPRARNAGVRVSPPEKLPLIQVPLFQMTACAGSSSL